MKRLLLCALCIAALEGFHPAGLRAQSCTLNAPSTLSGYQGQQYSIALSGVGNPYKVQYITDAYPNFNPGLGPGSERGISLGPTSGPAAFVLPINSTWNANGARLVTANVYDVLGNLLTNCSATATTANTFPVASNPTLSVTTGTPVTSNWSGAVTITLSVGNTGSDSINCYYFVDGLATSQPNGATACTSIGTIYTTYFSNGAHDVCVYVNDTTGGQTHTPRYEGEAAEWCRQVTFANGTTAMSASINNDKVYLAPTNTFTLTAQTLNTDGTTTAAAPLFFSANPAIVTAGQSSGVVTAVANGSTYVSALVPFVSGTDLATSASGNASSASNPFNLGEGPLTANAQWGCYISAGTGFTVGFYAITAIQFLGRSTYGASMGLPGNLAGGHYQCGPIAQSWIFVWPSNTLPYIGSDGSINTSYNALNAIVVHGAFGGVNLLIADQPYYYQGQANGAAYEFNNIGTWP